MLQAPGQGRGSGLAMQPHPCPVVRVLRATAKPLCGLCRTSHPTTESGTRKGQVGGNGHFLRPSRPGDRLHYPIGDINGGRTSRPSAPFRVGFARRSGALDPHPRTASVPRRGSNPPYLCRSVTVGTQQPTIPHILKVEVQVPLTTTPSLRKLLTTAPKRLRANRPRPGGSPTSKAGQIVPPKPPQPLIQICPAISRAWLHAPKYPTHPAQSAMSQRALPASPCRCDGA